MGTTFAIIAAGSQVYSQNKALQAQGKANRQTARNYIQSMNYSLQNLEQQRRDAFEATIDDLENTTMQGNRQEGIVNASVNEGFMGGGRTAKLIKRSAQADTNRALNSIKANYAKKSNEIDLNREATVMNTRRAISSIQEVTKPSIFSTLMSLGTAYLGAKSTAESISGMRHQAGVEGHTKDTSGLYPNRAQNWINNNWYDTYEDSFNPSTFSFSPTEFNYDITDYMPTTGYMRGFTLTDSPYEMTNWWRR